MFGSEIVDAAIGMIFTYLLLSLICSAVNELIERRLKNRATDLEKGLRELLNDPDGSNLVKKVYDHGMVNGLFRGEYDPKAADKSNLPSYIPSRNFALAILGLLVPDSGAPSSMASFREAIGKIENIQLKNALATMLSAAGEDVGRFRGSIKSWFNSAMDRGRRLKARVKRNPFPLDRSIRRSFCKGVSVIDAAGSSTVSIDNGAGATFLSELIGSAEVIDLLYSSRNRIRTCSTTNVRRRLEFLCDYEIEWRNCDDIWKGKLEDVFIVVRTQPRVAGWFDICRHTGRTSDHG